MDRHDARVRTSDAPGPPDSSTWRVELAVAALGLAAGLVVVLVFLA